MAHNFIYVALKHPPSALSIGACDFKSKSMPFRERILKISREPIAIHLYDTIHTRYDLRYNLPIQTNHRNDNQMTTLDDVAMAVHKIQFAHACAAFNNEDKNHLLFMNKIAIAETEYDLISQTYMKEKQTATLSNSTQAQQDANIDGTRPLALLTLNADIFFSPRTPMLFTINDFSACDFASEEDMKLEILIAVVRYLGNSYCLRDSNDDARVVNIESTLGEIKEKFDIDSLEINVTGHPIYIEWKGLVLTDAETLQELNLDAHAIQLNIKPK